MRPHRCPWIALGLAALLALAACDRAGTVSEAHVDALRPLAAETEMRIGDVDDPDVGFSRVAGADVDRDGNLYVLEASVPEIRVYGADGAILRRIGRRGAGPGEFASAPRFGVSGDTLWTLEHAGFTRLTLFDREGTVLSTGRTDGIRIPLPTSYGFLVPWLMRSDGKFTSHFAMVRFSRDDPPSGVQPTDSIPVPHVLFDATGAVIDTIGWAGRPPPRMWRPSPSRSEMVHAGGRQRFVPSPPSTAPWWEALRDGYVLVETPLAQADDDGVLRVARLGLSGDTVYSRTLHYRPARYAGDELDSIAARAARGEPGGMAPYAPPGPGAPPVPDDWQAIARVLRDAMKFPEFRLPIRNVWLAQDESLWLRRTGEDGAAARWIVLDPQGRPRGELALPPDVRIVWSSGDRFWAVDPDENDVQWLVRYRIGSG